MSAESPPEPPARGADSSNSRTLAIALEKASCPCCPSLQPLLCEAHWLSPHPRKEVPRPFSLIRRRRPLVLSRVERFGSSRPRAHWAKPVRAASRAASNFVLQNSRAATNRIIVRESCRGIWPADSASDRRLPCVFWRVPRERRPRVFSVGQSIACGGDYNRSLEKFQRSSEARWRRDFARRKLTTEARRPRRKRAEIRSWDVD